MQEKQFNQNDGNRGASRNGRSGRVERIILERQLPPRITLLLQLSFFLFSSSLCVSLCRRISRRSAEWSWLEAVRSEQRETEKREWRETECYFIEGRAERLGGLRQRRAGWSLAPLTKQPVLAVH